MRAIARTSSPVPRRLGGRTGQPFPQHTIGAGVGSVTPMRPTPRWPILVLVLVAGCGGGDSTPEESGTGLTAAGPAAEQAQGSLGDATHAAEGQEEEVLAGPVPITPETAQATSGKPLPRCTDDTITITAETRSRAEASAVCIINKVRRRRGRRALKNNAQLYSAASQHASDMVQHQYFSHVSAGGRGSAARIRSAGYTSSGSGGQLGENIAWGSGQLSTPAAIVQSWMNSAGHRANILRRSYRESGLAIAVGAPVQSSLEASTYVQTFGRR